MNRLLKTSLCVVAILMVAMLVLTGCGHSELEEGINNAQSSADKAASDAATNLAEAKKAVVDATAALEAAIATKADSTTLASEVTKLNAAIEAAKAIASTADGALKVELEAAIAAAKATIMAEGENLVRALDQEIVELLNTKASAASVEAKVAELNKMIKDMQAITGSAIFASLTDLNGVVASNRFLLDERFAELQATKDAGLYTDAQFEAIARAYKIADTVIIRATSQNVIDQAWTEFEAVVMSAEIRNEVDDFYIVVTNAKANGVADMKAAKDIYDLAADLATSDNDYQNALVQNYYGTDEEPVNLLAMAIEVYVAEVEDVIDELGDRYLVYPEASQDADEETGALAISGADDVADLEEARTYVDDVNAIYWASLDGTDYVLALSDDAVAKFEANETRMELLAAAMNAAKEVIALDKGYNDAAEGEEELNPITLKDAYNSQTIIDNIAAWKNAVSEWKTTYYVAVDDTANTETAQRAALLYALIAETEEKMIADYTTLMACAEEYKTEAYAFQLIVSNFYDDPAADASELYMGTLDLSKVTLDSKSTIDAAYAAYDAWTAKGYVVDLTGIIYGENEKMVKDSYTELAAIALDFEAKAETASLEWTAKNPAKIELTTSSITMYNESVPKALTWFDTYATKDGDAIVWDEIGDDNVAGYEDYEGNVIVTKEYYDLLVSLNTKLNELIGKKSEAAEALRNAIDALPAVADIKLSNKAAVENAKNLYDVYMAASAQSQYDHENVLNTEAADHYAKGRDFQLTDDQMDKVVKAKERVDMLQGKYDAIYTDVNALKALTVNTAYPYFAADVAGNAAARTTYEDLKDAIKEKLDDFVMAENNGGDTDFNNANLDEAYKAVKAAQENLARDTIFGKKYDLDQLNVNAAYPYFDDDDATDICTEADYKAALNALKDSLVATYDGLAQADVNGLVSDDVHATITAARKQLALDELYDAVKAMNDLNPGTAYPFFAADVADNDAARETYKAALAAIMTEFNDGYEGVKLVEADVADVFSTVIPNAKELIERDLVWKAYEALKASATVSETYIYFATLADRDAYNAAAEALRAQIYTEETGYIAVVGGTEKIADVIAALEAAELKVDKYDAFEGHFTAKYQDALDAVDATELTEDEANYVKGLLRVEYTRHKDVVDVKTLDELTNAEYKDAFYASLNAILAENGVAKIA